MTGNLQVWTNKAQFCVTMTYVVNGAPVTALSCMTTATGSDDPNCTVAGAGKKLSSKFGGIPYSYICCNGNL